MVSVKWLTNRIAPKTEVRQPTSSSVLPSPLSEDYVDEGVPHLHASHSRGGRWSFLGHLGVCICSGCWINTFLLFRHFFVTRGRTVAGQHIVCTVVFTAEPQYCKVVSDALNILHGHAELLQPRCGQDATAGWSCCYLSLSLLLCSLEAVQSQRHCVQQHQQQQQQQ